MIQELTDQINGMQDAFNKLFYKITQSLCSRGKTPQQLAALVLAHRSGKVKIPLWNKYEEELRASTSISESFIILRNHITFFNFELLAWIIQHKDVCTDEDRKLLQEYQAMFEKFCRRKVFRVPCHMLRPNTREDNTRNRTNFAVLLTMDEGEAMLLDVVKAKRKLATLLNLKAGALHLEWIDKGSLILVFSVPNFVAERLFPLEHHQALLLKSEGFTVFVPSTVGTGKTSL